MLAYLTSKKLNKSIELDLPSSVPVSSNRMSDESKEEIQERNQLVEKALEAYTIIWMSLGDNIKGLFFNIPMGDAYSLWKALLNKYESKTIVNKLHLRNQLMKCKMQEDESFDSYISKINKYAGELEGMGSKIEEDDLMSVVINGLPETFETLVQSISTKENLQFDSLCQLIREYQERKILKHKNDQSEESSHYSKHQNNYNNNKINNNRKRFNPTSRWNNSANNSTNNNNNNNDNTRTNGNSRHNNNNSRYNPTRSNNQNQNNSYDNKCTCCHKSGHTAINCWHNRNGNNYQNRNTSGKTYNNNAHRERERNAGLYAGHEYDKDITTSLMMGACEENAADKLEAELTGTKTKVSWILDSGATKYVVNDKTLLTNVKSIKPIQMLIANREKIKLNEVGQTNLVVNSNSQNRKKIQIPLNEVIHAPQFSANLLSVSSMVEKGCTVIFNSTEAIVERDGKTLMRIPKRGKLFILEQNRDEIVNSNNCISMPLIQSQDNESREDENINKIEMWHKRLGHLGESEMKKLKATDAVHGLEQVSSSDIQNYCGRNKPVCEPCVMGKMHRNAFGKYMPNPSKEILGRVFSDICGPVRASQKQLANYDGIIPSHNLENQFNVTESLGGNLYLLTLIDEYTRKIYGYTLKKKSEAADKIIEWCKQVQRETGRKIKQFHTDGGGEYAASNLQNYFKQEGIKHTTTTKGTPQHNGLAERANRTLFEMARAMLNQAKLPPSFWAAAVLTAIYIRNRCITSVNETRTSEEIWSGIKPTIKHFKVFGCVAYVNIQNDERKKLDAKAWKGIFIGYEPDKKGYRIFDPVTGKVIISRDVKFDEHTFITNLKQGEYNQVDFNYDAELLNKLSQVKDNSSGNDANNPIVIDEDDNGNIDSNNDNINDHDSHDDIRSEASSSINRVASIAPPLVDRVDDAPIMYHPDPPAPSPPRINNNNFGYDRNNNNVINNNRRPVRNIRRPQQDGMVNPDEIDWNEYENDSRYYIAMSAVVMNSTHITQTQSNHDESKTITYEEAMNSSEALQWKQAMDEEMKSLIENNTWELIDKPKRKNINIVGNKWILKKKLNSDGSVERYKARLVAKGYTQKYGIDYHETFAPVVKYKSIRIVFAIATIMKYAIEHVDFKTAFLNPIIKELVLMEQPKGYDDGNKNKVCKLNKTIYGTKQAPHEWNNELNSFLTSIGYNRCRSDTCMYVKKSKSNNIIIITLFVDDLLSIFDEQDRIEWNEDKNKIMNKYKVKDLGNIEWILGMKIDRDIKNKTMKITQELYNNKLMKQFNMDKMKPTNTPTNNYKLSSQDSPDINEESNIVDKKIYESMVGSLLYSSISTRPDISYAVSVISRYMKNPGQKHEEAAIKILRYLKGTVNTGLEYNCKDQLNNKELIIDAYCDADWSGDLDDRKSTTGYVIKLNGCSISWASKKQATVSLSSAEAEYMAISTTIQELKWIKQLIKEITGIEPKVNLWCDNQAAILISSNDVYHNRTKHIDIRHHFIRDAIQNKELEINYINTKQQIADILTKSLPRPTFQYLRNKLLNN